MLPARWQFVRQRQFSYVNVSSVRQPDVGKRLIFLRFSPDCIRATPFRERQFVRQRQVFLSFYVSVRTSAEANSDLIGKRNIEADK